MARSCMEVSINDIKFSKFLDKKEKPFLYRFDAHYKGENVGYLTSHKSDDGNYIWLKGMYVYKKFRRLGIARELMKMALKKYSGKEIRLRVRPYKHKAASAKDLKNFYSSFGFIEYDSEDRMVLRK